jgi:hypothetical protein
MFIVQLAWLYASLMVCIINVLIESISIRAHHKSNKDGIEIKPRNLK